MSIEYIVGKRITTLSNCKGCKGKGTNERSFRTKKYIYPCPVCKGSGKVKTQKTIRVTLQEALKDIKTKK